MLYPELTLTAGVSLTELAFADLFSARSLVTTLVAGLTTPLFDGGRRRARLASAQAEAERIAAEQRTALLRAAQEVIETQATLDSRSADRLESYLGYAPNVRITGQIPWNGPHADAPLPAGLEAFLARGEPPVVFTLGSSAVSNSMPSSRSTKSAPLGRRSAWSGKPCLMAEWGEPRI